MVTDVVNPALFQTDCARFSLMPMKLGTSHWFGGGVDVGKGVEVAVGVGVAVWVAVAVGVGVNVAVAVGVGVNVAVGVGLGGIVAVAVGVGVGDGLPPTKGCG